MTVIMVSGGYPENYAKGYEITGLDNIDSDIIVFNSGTKLSDDKLVTSGGRVLAVTTLGESLVSTREHIYDNLKKISFQDSYNRSDIGLDMIHYK
jgi:phosphoribosylamine--glycine ligase